jgi:formiminoglutamate deiminase
MGLALTRAAHEAGVRLTLLDTVYLRGGLTGTGYLPLDEVQRRFADPSVEAWATRVDGLVGDDRLRVGAAVHSVRAVSRDELAEVAAATDGRSPLHVHLSEQPAENLACEGYHGCSPTALLESVGLLRPTTTAVHATHLCQDDIGMLGDAGVTAAFCPTTERDLADGIGPARSLADAGAHLALGSDQHAVVDPFEEARGLEMHERLAHLHRGRFTASELLAAATVNGYRSLGWPDGGTLAPGYVADLVSVRLDSARTAGSAPDRLLYSATAADVTDVVVAGERVVEDGRHRLGDVGGLLARAIAAVRS